MDMEEIILIFIKVMKEDMKSMKNSNFGQNFQDGNKPKFVSFQVKKNELNK